MTEVTKKEEETFAMPLLELPLKEPLTTPLMKRLGLSRKVEVTRKEVGGSSQTGGSPAIPEAIAPGS